MESVIARSNSLRQPKAVPNERWCTPRIVGRAQDDGGTLLCRVSTSVWRRRKKAGGRWVALSGVAVIASRWIRRPGLWKTKHVPRRGSWWTRTVGGVCLHAVCFSKSFGKANAISVFGMLTKWLHITRLVTRTKETIISASIWVENPRA